MCCSRSVIFKGVDNFCCSGTFIPLTYKGTVLLVLWLSEGVLVSCPLILLQVDFDTFLKIKMLCSVHEQHIEDVETITCKSLFLQLHYIHIFQLTAYLQNSEFLS